MKILNRRYWREIPLCDYLKDSRVDGIVVTFTTSYDLPGILMFNYWQSYILPNRQQLKARSSVLKIVGAIMAHATSNDYLWNSARSYLRAMGAGGTTAQIRKSRMINDLRDFVLRCWRECWWICDMVANLVNIRILHRGSRNTIFLFNSGIGNKFNIQLRQTYSMSIILLIGYWNKGKREISKWLRAANTHIIICHYLCLIKGVSESKWKEQSSFQNNIFTRDNNLIIQSNIHTPN